MKDTTGFLKAVSERGLIAIDFVCIYLNLYIGLIVPVLTNISNSTLVAKQLMQL